MTNEPTNPPTKSDSSKEEPSVAVYRGASTNICEKTLIYSRAEIKLNGKLFGAYLTTDDQGPETFGEWCGVNGTVAIENKPRTASTSNVEFDGNNEIRKPGSEFAYETIPGGKNTKKAAEATRNAVIRAFSDSKLTLTEAKQLDALRSAVAKAMENTAISDQEATDIVNAAAKIAPKAKAQIIYTAKRG